MQMNTNENKVLRYNILHHIKKTKYIHASNADVAHTVLE